MAKELSKKIIEPVVNVNEVSRIAENVTIKGDISSSSDLRIDGQIDGTLYSKGRIVVGEGAQLKGTVLCNDMDFRGKITGDIYAREILSLKESSSVDGNIKTHSLQVALGASINGSCKMITEDAYDESVGQLVSLTAPAQK